MKRRNNDEEEADAAVDDLVVASMHAAAIMTWSCPREPIKKDDDNDDDDDDDDSSNDSSESKEDSSSSVLVDDDDEEDDDEEEEEVKNENSLVVDTAGAPNYANEDSDDFLDNDDDDDDDDADMKNYHVNSSSSQSKRNGVNNNQSKNNSNLNLAYDGALRTENEIDPYRCPTEKLEKLNVLGTTTVAGVYEHSNTDTTNNIHHGVVGGGNEELELSINDEITNKLQIAGIVRSYIPGQRTIVVDSSIPPSLLSGNSNSGQRPLNEVTLPLDVGSLLVVIVKQQQQQPLQQQQQSEAECGDNIVKKYIPITLNEMYATETKITATMTTKCTIHVLGKIMEIFGPIQRPFYAIRLPDPPKATVLQAQEEDPLLNEMKIPSSEEVDGSDNKVFITIGPINSNAIEGEKNEEIKDQVSNSTPTFNAVNEVVHLDSNDTVSMTAPIIDNNTQSNLTNETKIKVQNTDEADDPWSSNGRLSIMFKSYPNAIVYSLTNHSTIIDTLKVMQISGRGCDASNMYDEELGVNEQQYYSDDEQERVAKRGGGSSGTSKPSKHATSEEQQHGGNTPPNRGGRSDGNVSGGFGGRRGGRGGGGRGRGRGGRERAGRERSCSSQQQHHHHQPHYLQQPMQFQQHPPYMQQPPPTTATTNYSTYQNGMYQQPQSQQYQSHQYQSQQYTQQQHQQYPYYGVIGQQSQFSPHGVPPPPPPPPPPRLIGTTQQPPPEENDTVYYDYS